MNEKVQEPARVLSDVCQVEVWFRSERDVRERRKVGINRHIPAGWYFAILGSGKDLAGPFATEAAAREAAAAECVS